MNKLWFILAFSAGFATGYVATIKIVENIYSQISKEEIESVKKAYAKQIPLNKEIEKTDTNITETTEPQIPRKELKNLVTSLGYAPTIVEDVSDKYSPSVIAPESFGETDYDTKTLALYEDGILADAITGAVIDYDDIPDVIGTLALDSFGEYDDDSVYVRNDELHTDYEIIKEARRYDDVYSVNKHSSSDD